MTRHEIMKSVAQGTMDRSIYRPWPRLTVLMPHVTINTGKSGIRIGINRGGGMLRGIRSSAMGSLEGENQSNSTTAIHGYKAARPG